MDNVASHLVSSSSGHARLYQSINREYHAKYCLTLYSLVSHFPLKPSSWLTSWLKLTGSQRFNLKDDHSRVSEWLSTPRLSVINVFSPACSLKVKNKHVYFGYWFTFNGSVLRKLEQRFFKSDSFGQHILQLFKKSVKVSAFRQKSDKKTQFWRKNSNCKQTAEKVSNQLPKSK